MSVHSTGSFGAIPPDWVPLVDLGSWIERWRGSPPPREILQNVVYLVRTADATIRYRVASLTSENVRTTKSYGGHRTVISPRGMKISRTDSRSVIIENWEHAGFDPNT